MGNVNQLIAERLKKGSSTKMTTLAEKSTSGQLTSFSGVFSVTELNNQEREFLENILRDYATGFENFDEDLTSLLSITSEVKAINNQAAILHGERIKKAQSILTKYRDGAFTSWLIAAYGNRQTPYNFLQYYEFYDQLPKPMRLQVEAMPRQAIYTLATREASLEQKTRFIEDFQGETKAFLLNKIRELFPLEESDRRKANLAESTLKQLLRIKSQLSNKKIKISQGKKAAIYDILDELRELVSEK